jgi:hypothetical protein
MGTTSRITATTITINKLISEQIKTTNGKSLVAE